MSPSKQRFAPRWRSLASGLRTLAAPAGVYAYLLTALMVASGAARADDLDVYTKATAVSGGSPVVAMATDTSEDMMCSLLQANCKGAATPADTVLHERSYGMKDALRAVMTSGPGNMRISLTDYGTDGTYDDGRIIQEQKRVADVESVLSAPVTTFTSPITKRISKGEYDATQTAAGSVRLADAGITIPVKQYASPYAGTVNSSWTSSGGAGLGGTAADGIEDAITDITKYTNAYSNGNKVYYYYHTNTSDLTQTFTLDTANAATNPVLFFIDYYVSPWVVMKYNDDRSATYLCLNANYPYYKAADKKCYKKADFTGGSQAATLSVNKNSTVSMTGLTANRWYMLVVATRDAGKADTFTLAMADPTKGMFWDSDAYTSDENQTAGFYFPDLQIPKGASITSARLVFKNIGGSGSSANPQLEVGTDKNPNALPFTAQSINARLANTDWGGITRTLDRAVANPEIDVTNRIKDIVERDGWCPGNAGAILIRNKTSSIADWIKVASFESDPANAPLLVVNFDPTSGDPDACNDARALTLRVSAMSEDTNQFADGTMDVNKDYMPSSGVDATLADKRGRLWLSKDTKVGLRFTLAKIPPGATIVSAKLKLTARGTTGAQPIKVAGILSKDGNVQAFFPDTKYLDSVNLTSAIDWSPLTWVDGTVYESPELKTLVQAQIDQAGWASDNTLGFLLQGTSSSVIKACAWEYGPSGGFNSTDPAQFGSCAAQLDLLIDDNGQAVTKTYRSVLVDRLMNLKKTGRQPMGGAYLKTARYLAGKFSGFSADGIADQGSVDLASPVKPHVATGDCASNTIIFISDVNEEGNYKADFADRYGTFASSVGGSIACGTSGSGDNQSSLNCNRALAQLLFDGFTPDGAADIASVKTYTFNFNATAGGAGGTDGAVDLTTSDSGGGNLRSIAESGGGAFKQSGSSATLVKQLLTVLRSIADTGASVAAPGISVNALNRFEHLDQMYYSLFKPSTKIDWTGNLKRYQLLNSRVADVNGNVAVDFVSNGFFKTDSRSFWSPGTDGATVTIGGAATESDATERRIFTYLGDNAAAASTTLTDQLVQTNYAIDEYALGIDRLSDFFVAGGALANQTLVDARRAQVIDFLRATPKDETTVLWGASIHNSPRIVTFKNDPVSPVITVLYGDNRGFLHAIDAGELTSSDPNVNIANTGGKELMAFIPKELLRNSALFHENTRSVTSDGYVYGLDGDIRLVRTDANYDGNVEKLVALAGMRRGGSNYYAIDMSKARSDVPVADRVPKLEWVIQGGVGDYAEMGQSWSALSVNYIQLGGQKKNIVAFGGGYDPAYHDDGVFGSSAGVPYTNALQKGHALYIADVETGKLIWKSTNLSAATFPALAAMKYSIVATPRLLDRNGDGAYDVIYVVDMAGQVFRFELNRAATGASDLIDKVVLVARLGATGTTPAADPVLDNRRFYEPPTIAYSGNDVILGLLSGYREEPGNKGATGTKEAFFFVRDIGAWNTVTNPSTIELANLTDLTGATTVSAVDLSSPGWYVRLDQSIGEKGIGSPVFFNSAVLFGTFVVESVASACVPDIGKTRLYLMDFAGNGLMNDLDGDGLLDRFMDIGLPGMADTPQIIYADGGSRLDVGVGLRVLNGETEVCADGINCPLDPGAGGLQRKRWYIVE